jgi:hypothetical protein
MDEFLKAFQSAWKTSEKSAIWMDPRTALKSSKELSEVLREFLTQDPVFGRVCDRDLSFFFDTTKWQKFCA